MLASCPAKPSPCITTRKNLLSCLATKRPCAARWAAVQTGVRPAVPANGLRPCRRQRNNVPTWKKKFEHVVINYRYLAVFSHHSEDMPGTMPLDVVETSMYNQATAFL